MLSVSRLLNSALASALPRRLRNALAALTGNLPGPTLPFLWETESRYLKYGTACFLEITFSSVDFAWPRLIPLMKCAMLTESLSDMSTSLTLAIAVFSGIFSIEYPFIFHHFNGMNFDDLVAPTPGPECFTSFR